MCQERKRTRDRLLEYDLPLHPRAGGLAMVYPWEDNEKRVLKKQIYDIAVESGFNGSEHEFWNSFSGGQIITGINPFDFPVPGSEKNLYVSESSGAVYCFRVMTIEAIEDNLPAGAIIVATVNNIAYLYIPIRAALLENAILFGGEA